jgi:hypothetical protein
MDLDYSELNDDWINNFDKNDNLYKDFYKDNLYYINIDFIYINRNNEIEKIKQESVLLSVQNYITRDELIGLLKRNSIDNNIKYSLMSLLKYNITLDPDDIKNFLLSNDTSFYNDKFLINNKDIDTIIFEKTINMFQDLNSLFIIFYEKIKENKSTNINTGTKRAYMKQNTNRKTLKNH